MVPTAVVFHYIITFNVCCFKTFLPKSYFFTRASLLNKYQLLLTWAHLPALLVPWQQVRNQPLALRQHGPEPCQERLCSTLRKESVMNFPDGPETGAFGPPLYAVLSVQEAGFLCL